MTHDQLDIAEQSMGAPLIHAAIARLAGVLLDQCDAVVCAAGKAPRRCGSMGILVGYTDPLGRPQWACLCPRHGGSVEMAVRWR